MAPPLRYIDVAICAGMIEHARQIGEQVRVHRTVASPIDTLVGLVGEFAFAQWFLGDWRRHDALGTRGKADIDDRIEIKTSAFPFSAGLNLLVREDYAARRRPECYVQLIIDTPDRQARGLQPGWNCRLSGWATADEVDAAPLRDFGAKGGGRGGYRCRYISIRDLHPMGSFPIPRPVP